MTFYLQLGSVSCRCLKTLFDWWMRDVYSINQIIKLKRNFQPRFKYQNQTELASFSLAPSCTNTASRC